MKIMNHHVSIFLVILTLFSGSISAQSNIQVRNKAKDLYHGHRIVYQVMTKDTNIRHGNYIYYFHGQKVVEGKYHIGKKHGAWKRFYPNGEVYVKANYIMDRKHGKWEYFFSDGSMRAQTFFKGGQKTGVWKGYYYGGYPAIVHQYRADTLTGDQIRYYHPSDTKDKHVDPIKKELYRIRTDGKIYKEQYFPSGKLYQKVVMLGEKVDSIRETYYHTTLLWSRFKYTQGRLDAIYDYNNPVGRDHNRGTFRNGSGELLLYHYDGSLASRVDMLGGKTHGKVTYFFNEQKTSEGYYTRGNRTGTWKSYNIFKKKQKLEKETHYFSNDSAFIIEYHGDGRARSEGTVVNNKKEGIWRTYDLYDELRSVVHYKNGLKHGNFTDYNPGGYINVKGGYYHNIKVGTWNYYNDFGRVGYKEVYTNQVTARESYFASDSCRPRDQMERTFYSISRSVSLNDRITAYLSANRTVLHFDSYIGKGRFPNYVFFSSQRNSSDEYSNQATLLEPRLLTQSSQAEINKVEDYDLGLLLKTLNPIRLRNKKEPSDPKIGVGMVLVEFDEFGSVSKASTLRGIDQEWDQKILKLYTDQYTFWEPAWVSELPIAVRMEQKIPIEYLEVKKLKK
ncbi:hypothetical protein KFE98_06785 [bacterium SCSIO 12741]|nr:hypothetical protein KFE98_06785 [bacterium SCSIO 12741]